ncbi:MAG: winged helix-turn-helix transcriptional regulator [Inquilinus sp.]|nr:winged helix-turn-helix transcriptional regulator [Inquilinus sp.]
MQHPYYQSILLIERLHRQFLELVKAELERRGIHDINNVQSLILYNISNDDLTVGELTARGYYLGSNVSYNVKKMVENGYLVQERSLHDRRSVRVRLSEKGLALRDKLREMFERQVEGLNSANISETSITELNRSLIDMERYLVGRLGYAIGGAPSAA